MKNLFNTAVGILLVLGVTNSFAQTKGQLDVLTEIGEGTLFKKYDIYKKEGNWTGRSYETKYETKFVRNMHGKLSAFYMATEGTDKKNVNVGFGWLEPNHYTQPSVFHAPDHKYAYVYLDGLFYGMSKVNDPLNVDNFKLEHVYIPQNAGGKAPAEEGKKKMTMKEKLAATKAKMKAGGIPAAITGKDHEAIIKKYIADMKPVQDKATSNFTAQIKGEIAAIEKGGEELEAKRVEQWGERQKELAEIRGNEKVYTIKNTGKSTLELYYGVSFSLRPGDSKTINCSQDVHYAERSGSTVKAGGLVADGSSSCGKTINVN
jgi:hypothetical protein